MPIRLSSGAPTGLVSAKRHGILQGRAESARPLSFNMRKRVVVFGIFDGIHEGHRDFFRQAKEHGDELVVIVGRDSASLKWKGKQPKGRQQEGNSHA